MIRKELSAFARFDPRKARHHRNPRVALSVIGLDMLTENPELGRLFVRLNMESKLRLIEDFEDGSYVDLSSCARTRSGRCMPVPRSERRRRIP